MVRMFNKKCAVLFNQVLIIIAVKKIAKNIFLIKREAEYSVNHICHYKGMQFFHDIGYNFLCSKQVLIYKIAYR